MSRSNPTLQKPASKYFEYKAEKGILQYYDRDKAETFIVPFPFQFSVLDELNTITGYSKPHNASHYSNEVRNSLKEPFTIMLKGAQVYHGLYKNEQKVVQVPRAAVYTKSIYIAYQEESEWHIGNIKLAGSGMSSWIDFTEHLKVQDSGKVIMTKGPVVEGEKGNYYPPGFEYVKETTTEEDKIAWQLDEVLQTYLKQYFINQGTPDDEQEPQTADEPSKADSYNTADGTASPEQIARFEKLKAEKLSKPLQANDYPEASQETYNHVASSEYEFTDDMLPPEFRS